MHEPLTNLRRVVVVQVERGVPETEVWRALYAAASFQRPWGKYIIAVNEDIDPENTDAVFWAMSYRANPERDTHVLRHKDSGHGPRSASAEDSALLINATLRQDAPPLSLPERRYMEAAKDLWERLGLPALRPEAPWPTASASLPKRWPNGLDHCWRNGEEPMRVLWRGMALAQARERKHDHTD